jgi:hypothetical protein
MGPGQAVRACEKEESDMINSRYARPVAAASAVLVSALLLGSASHADTACRSVEGRYEERDASGPGCISPVGLCIAGLYAGDIKGPFAGQATAIVPTADTPTTGVLLFTSDSTIDARIGGLRGTLIVKNSGAFQTSGGGSIVDLQSIVGGTGELSGATGALRAEGTFSVTTGGASRYTGTVCLP